MRKSILKLYKRLNHRGRALLGLLAVLLLTMIFMLGRTIAANGAKTEPSAPEPVESQPKVITLKVVEPQEKRYELTDAERWEIASVITAEAEGEPFAGKVAVAQCILQACEDDGIRPCDALKEYKYSSKRPVPCEEALKAVQAVFDSGQVASYEPIKYFYAPALVTSEWHESQIYVMTINGHRFFKEATE